MDNLVKENNLFFRIKKVGLTNQKKQKTRPHPKINFWQKKGDRPLFLEGRRPPLLVDISYRKSSLSPFFSKSISVGT